MDRREAGQLVDGFLSGKMSCSYCSDLNDLINKIRKGKVDREVFIDKLSQIT